MAVYTRGGTARQCPWLSTHAASPGVVGSWALLLRTIAKFQSNGAPTSKPSPGAQQPVLRVSALQGAGDWATWPRRQSGRGTLEAESLLP